jgi:hypothetical protein
MRSGSWFAVALATALVALVFGAAYAGPWAQVGDSQLRTDIQILAGAGVVDDVTMQWPIPWAGLLDRLDAPGVLDGQPDYVRQAAARVRQEGAFETQKDTLRASIMLDAASSPNVVRAFDALGRQSILGQASIDYLWKTTAIHIALGARSSSGTDHQTFVPDNSYVAQRLGNAVIYAGYMTHWWGPGWISAMSLSNNARPFPQIGISRITTAPFESSWLSWIGPWQLEFFVGVLDGHRVASNTIYDGLRVEVSPIPHLEIAFSRTDEMCGTGHPCKPLAAYFNLQNKPGEVNTVNDEATMELKYSRSFERIGFEIYTQAMNEDTNPFHHSGTSHLFGGSLWTPLRGGVGRITFEYADSLATKDLWGSGTFPGFSYNNFGYPDGMRYRGRTLGFSLDSDSQLYTVQASFTDNHRRSFTLTYHHADVSDTLVNSDVGFFSNVVTTVPVTINQLQARASFPFGLSDRRLRLDIEGRVQDDQPRPDHGFLASIEAALAVDL